MKKTLLILLFAVLSRVCLAEGIRPTATILYAHKDTCDLYFDYYAPDPQAAVNPDGSSKPTVMFAFGGGFRSGCRDDKYFIDWFPLLTKAGYGVVSIDYRLALKGLKFDFFKFIKATGVAIQAAVEDLFSATLYLLDHGAELGIDPGNIVISGSSAGAITSLQAEYEICNGGALASVLPENFNYAGVMSFSGAIYSHDGKIKYRKAPCPQLLLHGTADKMVPYRKLQLLNICFAGSDVIARSLRKDGHVYSIYRYKGNSHEISGLMQHAFPLQLQFLQNSVAGHGKACIDATVQDPEIFIPEWARRGAKTLY